MYDINASHDDFHTALLKLHFDDVFDLKGSWSAWHRSPFSCIPEGQRAQQIRNSLSGKTRSPVDLNDGAVSRDNTDPAHSNSRMQNQ